MINLIQFIVAPDATGIEVQTETLTAPVTQGNIIVITGKFNVVPGSTLAVSDSLGNTYSINQPFDSTDGSSYWFAYAVAQSTGALTVTAIYSVSVSLSSFTVIEFFNSIGWVNPPQADGSSFLGGNSGSPVSAPLTTTNADDLLILLYGKSAPASTILSPAWHLVVQQATNQEVFWMEAIPAGLISPFSASQSPAGLWSVAVWALQANLVAPNTINIVTAVVNPTAFVEAYPNRIKEDIYDCLDGNTDFIYVPYGPSFLNV